MEVPGGFGDILEVLGFVDVDFAEAGFGVGDFKGWLGNDVVAGFGVAGD